MSCWWEMQHRPCSSKQIGGPGPTIPLNEVMGSTSASTSTSTSNTHHHHHHNTINNILPPPISTSPNPLQPFHIFNSTTAINFQGEKMAATIGFPFTAAQWKELERQAMIYKYMVASVPVPYELLLPIIQNIPPSHPPLVRYSTKQDLEPGRCKRTDGKKWRCSRDVAPNQKYCERHMHRGRPRSRKHVELSKNQTNACSSSLVTNNNKTRLPSSSIHSNNPTKVVGSTTVLPSATQAPLFLDNNNMNLKTVSNRGLDWSLEGGSEQQWRQIMQTSRSIFNSDFGEDLSSFTDFGTPRRDLIDAWSTDRSNVVKDSSVCCTENVGLDLSMAMALGNNGLGEIERGLGGGTAPGGPLAEVLRPSLVGVRGACSNPTSPYPTTGTGDSESISPAVSSPSGVLQRTMLSLSDGSVCNSPTLAASSTPTDVVGFQWFT